LKTRCFCILEKDCITKWSKGKGEIHFSVFSKCFFCSAIFKRKKPLNVIKVVNLVGLFSQFGFVFQIVAAADSARAARGRGGAPPPARAKFDIYHARSA
jgi:hypothetical protein